MWGMARRGSRNLLGFLGCKFEHVELAIEIEHGIKLWALRVYVLLADP